MRVTVLDSFKPYLHERFADGERHATVLLVEIAEQGYTGGDTTLARYLRPLRSVDAAALAKMPQRRPPPTVRRITGVPGHLDPADAVHLDAIRARCPEFDAAVRHVAGFARMIKDRSGDKDKLTAWMGAVDANDLPALRSFTNGLCRDLDAVIAGLTPDRNSGAVEGTVNRIKSSKRRCTNVRTGPPAQADTPGLNLSTWFRDDAMPGVKHATWQEDCRRPGREARHHTGQAVSRGGPAPQHLSTPSQHHGKCDRTIYREQRLAVDFTKV